ncbi:MAG: hypothetical protein ACP5SP_05805 [Caldisericum sp.]|uniref:hypothetical protein n=1 Tax=Caldisericum sp. TaxID=2499687 RepID=UPI003D09E297
MEDKLYEGFYDPTQEFSKDPRAFCYELAEEFIKKSKQILKTGMKKRILLRGYSYYYSPGISLQYQPKSWILRMWENSFERIKIS